MAQSKSSHRSVLAVAMLLLGLTSTQLATSSEAAVDPPKWLGVTTTPRGESTDIQVIASLERRLGHKFRIARVFKAWDAPFPNRFDSWLIDGKTRMIVSVKADRLSGAKVSWADIAAAQPGSPMYGEIERWALALKALPQPSYFIFHHEPEVKGHEVYGEAPQFIDAWRKVVTVFRATGATNVKFLWTMTDLAFRVPSTDPRRAATWYPGDSYVDAIGADVYNWSNCRSPDEAWKGLREMIDGQRQFGLKHPTKELWLPELGSLEDGTQPDRKAVWLTEVQQLLKEPDWQQYRGVVYFHSEHNERYPNCDWWVDTSSESLNAFGAWISDPFYGGDGIAAPVISVRIDGPSVGLTPAQRLTARTP
jgi:Glycosyl hydrolase family 26